MFEMLAATAFAMGSGWFAPHVESGFGCVPDPLPKWPVSYLSSPGPSVAFAPASAGDDRYQMTVQRLRCRDDSIAVLAFFNNTFDGPVTQILVPLTQWRVPRVCESDIVVVQGQSQFQPELYFGAPRHDTRSCVDVRTTATALLLAPAGTSFDPASSFEIRIPDRHGVIQSAQIPSGTPAMVHADWLTPHDSGHYFDRDRSGEGMFLTVGHAGEVCHGQHGASDCDYYTWFLAWFTYENGEQLWLTASQGGVRRDQEWYTAPLVLSRGARYGAGFQPGDVVREGWGEIRWRVRGCSVLEGQWSRASSGATGSFRMTRGVGLIDGYFGCGDTEEGL